jgi:phosphopantothenoylcysteine decarboxylase / phosphopantothenate---cysteine ligase
MGISIATIAAEYGANVDLVLGPVGIHPENTAINVISVTSASSMAEECIRRFTKSDIAILSAAVADFTPQIVNDRKIKRGNKEIVLKLIPTTDIAAELGKRKKNGQLLVGFALETENEIDNAKDKLKRKNLDLIVLNSLNDKGAGFGFETNRITIIDKNNNIDKFELKSKDDAARDIIDKIVSIIS